MTDVHSKEVRSYNMSKIKGKDTKPEIMVRKYLFSKGYRYRINVKSLPGKPDIVLSRYRTVIFINGCFWHGHQGCRYFVIPKTRSEWWVEKIQKNTERDKHEQAELSQNGWHILTIWECQLKPKKRDKTLSELELFLQKICPDIHRRYNPGEDYYSFVAEPDSDYGMD